MYLYIQSIVSTLNYEAISSTGFVGYRGYKNTFVMDAMKYSKYFTLPILYRNTIIMIRYSVTIYQQIY